MQKGLFSLSKGLAAAALIASQAYDASVCVENVHRRGGGTSPSGLVPGLRKRIQEAKQSGNQPSAFDADRGPLR
jgi:hypothetical protein